MKNKMLAGVITLALAFPFAALRADEAKAKTEDHKEAKEPTYAAACPSPCEFSVKSHDKKEVAAVLKEHAKSHHHMDLSDKDADGMIKEHGAKK